ncbi:MAG: methyltransferase domain-containing protein [Jiangellaceae bacterium]
MTITPDDPRRVFAHIDRTAFAPEIMAYLEAVASLPEIRAWRAIADELMAVVPGMRVLDAGCGLGEVARDLAAAVGLGGDVTAVDVSARMVDAARSRDAGAGVTYEVADMTDLPYASGSFDRSRSERVLQHLADPDAALAELVRVTVADGIVCVLDSDWRSVAVDVDDPDLSGAVLAAMGAVSPQPDLGRTLRRRMVRAGLVDVEVRVHAITYTAPSAAAAVYPFLNEQIPPEAGIIPPELRDRWFAALRRAEAEGIFWMATLGYVACGTVPEAAA